MANFYHHFQEFVVFLVHFQYTLYTDVLPSPPWINRWMTTLCLADEELYFKSASEYLKIYLLSDMKAKTKIRIPPYLCLLVSSHSDSSSRWDFASSEVSEGQNSRTSMVDQWEGTTPCILPTGHPSCPNAVIHSLSPIFHRIYLYCYMEIGLVADASGSYQLLWVPLLPYVIQQLWVALKWLAQPAASPTPGHPPLTITHPHSYFHWQ